MRVAALGPTGGEVAHGRIAAVLPAGARPGAQPAIRSVAIRGDLLLVNDRPWMPWGAVYGFVPVYAGPEGTRPVRIRDLHNLPDWNIYDRFTSAPYSRRLTTSTACGTWPARSPIPRRWRRAGRRTTSTAASAFVTPQPAFSLDDLAKQAGRPGQAGRHLPQVLSQGADGGLGRAGHRGGVRALPGAGRDSSGGSGRWPSTCGEQTGKPVMVGHGGSWNRFEFEKVPVFRHLRPRDRAPLPGRPPHRPGAARRGANRVIWLRPQMYEDVPYERWRFHIYVELMRGCRGWQIAARPGRPVPLPWPARRARVPQADRRLDGPRPGRTIEPPIEHWSRRHDGKLYLIAATTRGIPFGARTRGPGGPGVPSPVRPATRPGDRPDFTASRSSRRPTGPRGPAHAVGPARPHRAPPTNLASWSRPTAVDPRGHLGRRPDDSPSRKTRRRAYWFLKTLLPHAEGFLGWDEKLVPTALDTPRPNDRIGSASCWFMDQAGSVARHGWNNRPTH